MAMNIRQENEYGGLLFLCKWGSYGIWVGCLLRLDIGKLLLLKEIFVWLLGEVLQWLFADSWNICIDFGQFFVECWWFCPFPFSVTTFVFPLLSADNIKEKLMNSFNWKTNNASVYIYFTWTETVIQAWYRVRVLRKICHILTNIVVQHIFVFHVFRWVWNF